MNTLVSVLSRVSYGAFLILVLAPVSLACYVGAAVVSSAWTHLQAGWRDHRK